MSSILLCSLKAHEVMMANTASNVANMNTPGYKAIRTTITHSLEGGVSVATTRSDEAMPLDMEGVEHSNVDPARELVGMIMVKTGFEAVLNAISTREEMLDDLMDVLAKR